MPGTIRAKNAERGDGSSTIACVNRQALLAVSLSMIIRRVLLAALAATVSLPASALQVQVFPAGDLYVGQANPDHHYVDLVLHNIIVVNDGRSAVDVSNVTIDVLEGERILESRSISAGEIRATTSEISGRGQLATAQLDTDFPWQALRDRGITLGTGSRLQPKQAAAIKNVFMTVQGVPTSVRVRATASGKTATTRVAVSQRKSPNSYRSPVKGVWYMRSIPNITSHHRWNTQTEFAVDFFKMGDNGLPWKTDGRSAADFYAFGEPVFAAADGVVVDAESRSVQDYDVRLQRQGESDEAYDARLTKYNLELLKSGAKALLGNFVVIEHAGGEFTSYDHLKTGSVSVKKGDRVVAGQQIAAIGDTGDTNIVHLHFQVSDGPDPLQARSIPFTLVDLRPSGGDLGRMVRTPK